MVIISFSRANLAEASLRIGAIKLRPEDPFQWTSGYRMPIYNDNRMLLFNPELRVMVTKGFTEALERSDLSPEIIAGTSTAGIAPAISLANMLGLPLIYVRDKPKGHGMQNRIEGIDAESDLEERSVVVVEDLISTGGSSANAVQGVRNANGVCSTLVSIFTYGLAKAKEKFTEMEPSVRAISLLDYTTLLDVAFHEGYINDEKKAMLTEWRADPFSWGEARGFPRVIKGE